MRQPLSILVVKLSAIGDVIHALPVAYAIKETFPDARLVWVVEAMARPILERVPYIDEVITFDKPKFKTPGGLLREFSPFRRKLRAAARKSGGYDYSLDLQGLFKSAAIVFFAGTKKRYGTEFMRELSDYVSRPVVGANAGGHIVERYLDVARAIGCRVEKVVFPIELTEADYSAATARLQRSCPAIADGRPYAVLCVGASWPNKRWPNRKFAALSDRLFERGIIPVFVGGGKADEAALAEVSAAAQFPPISLVGQTTLPVLAAVLKNAAVVIGGDTGPVHLAAAVAAPIVMLMGPTSTARTGPYRQEHRVVEAGHNCAGCRQRVCPKGRDCLDAISVEAVEQRISEIIEGKI